MTPELAARSVYRVAALRDLVGSLTADVRRWFGTRGHDERFRRFRGHFTVLGDVLGRLLHDLDAAAAATPSGNGSGPVYATCHDLERSLLVVHRLFDWYASKYDQRLDPGTGAVLAAADELVRSCWAEPFVALGRRPPTGPLPYVEIRFDASATVRESVPPDLRAPADDLVAEFVRELPVPTVALPAAVRRGAWWLGLLAHETGHHVQWDVDPGLRAATRAAVAGAVDDDLVGPWVGWAAEVFADAWAVLMLGPPAVTVIDELQHAGAPDDTGGGRYPPPAVRTALLGELSRRCWPLTGDWPPSARAVRRWVGEHARPGPARELVARHLAAVPSIVDALSTLPVGHTDLSTAAAGRPEWFGPDGRVGSWAAKLLRPAPLFTGTGTRPAARVAAAAGLTAYRSLQATTPFDGERLRLLHDNLVGLLGRCGEPGTLTAPSSVDIADLGARLSHRLLAAS